MQLDVFRSCLVFSLIELLVAGGIDEINRLVDHNDLFVRAGNRKVSPLRRRLQPIRGRKDQEELVPVIIGVNDGSDGVLEKLFPRLSTLVRQKFKRINAWSAFVSQDELNELKEDPNILYVEEDPMVYPDSDEAPLYGLQMVQAFASTVLKQNYNVTAACNDPKSFKIGIIDSGLAM